MKILPNTKMTKYNPDKFRSEVAMLNPSDAADVATNWRGKYAAVKNEMAKQTEKFINVGVTGGTALVMGWFSGRDMYNKKALIEDYKADVLRGEVEGVTAADISDLTDAEILDKYLSDEDPTKLFGIPKTLLATIVLGGLAVWKPFGKNYDPFVESAAIGALATWASGFGAGLGYQNAERASVEENGNGNGNGA